MEMAVKNKSSASWSLLSLEEAIKYKNITWAKGIPEMDGVQKLGDVNSMGHS